MVRIRQRKLGILTGGGDCPGLNAVIRAIVRQAAPAGYQVHGFISGWEGILKRKSRMLREPDVDGILQQGGTILHSSRTNPYKDKQTEQTLYRAMKALKLAGLIVIGGEDTLGVAARLSTKGFPIIGIPKTIDNDIMGSDLTVGFDTAVTVATEAIDRLHTTAESHDRVIVVEVMGRDAGWIATYAGLAGGADAILIPERPFAVKDVCDILRQQHRRNKTFSLIVVAEGAKMKAQGGGELAIMSETRDEFGHVRLGGIGHRLARAIGEQTAMEARAVVLGYLQRSGVPSAFDRILGTRFGVRAVRLLEAGRFGRLVAWKQGDVKDVALSIVKKGIKHVDPKLYKVAETFFG